MKNEFQQVKQDVNDLAKAKWNLAWLRSLRYAANVWARFSSSLIIIGVLAITLSFVTLALSFYLGELVGSYAGGFGIMSFFWLLVFLLLLLTNKKGLQKYLKDRFVQQTSTELDFYIPLENEDKEHTRTQ